MSKIKEWIEEKIESIVLWWWLSKGVISNLILFVIGFVISFTILGLSFLLLYHHLSLKILLLDSTFLSLPITLLIYLYLITYYCTRLN